jgi:hypothetical protein
MRIDAASELASMRQRLDRHLGKARTALDGAGTACGLEKRGPAKRRLRAVRKRLRRLAKTLRHGDPPAVTVPLVERAQALAAEARALGISLTCP